MFKTLFSSQYISVIKSLNFNCNHWSNLLAHALSQFDYRISKQDKIETVRYLRAEFNIPLTIEALDACIKIGLEKQ